MKRCIPCTLALCLLASVAQTRETMDSPFRGLGEIGWIMDVKAITGDPRCLGVEFDGNGIYNTFPNPGLDIYGAAMESSDPDHPMLWLWSRDGPTGSFASEYARWSGN